MRLLLGDSPVTSGDAAWHALIEHQWSRPALYAALTDQLLSRRRAELLSSNMPNELDVAHQRKSTEVYLDFQWKTLVQTADLLSKGIGFYFLLLIAVTGAIFQAKLTPSEVRIAVWTVLLISISVGLAFVALTWGIVQGLYELERTVEKVNPDLYRELGLCAYFRRARTIARIVVIACVASMLLIVVATFILQYRA